MAKTKKKTTKRASKVKKKITSKLKHKAPKKAVKKAHPKKPAKHAKKQAQKTRPAAIKTKPKAKTSKPVKMHKAPLQRPRPKGAEQRRYPRRSTEVKAKLTNTNNNQLTFEAYLHTRDVSIGGMFFESQFFVENGTIFDVEFSLPEFPSPIQVRGEVVRKVTGDDPRKRGAGTGFAIHFTEYGDNAMGALAAHFLAPKAIDFVKNFTNRKAHRGQSEQERMMNLILFWELDKMESGEAAFDY